MFFSKNSTLPSKCPANQRIRWPLARWLSPAHPRYPAAAKRVARLCTATILAFGALSFAPPANNLARAQGSPQNAASQPGWVRNFDDIKTEVIKPADLPTIAGPGPQRGVATAGKKLPKAASQAELRAVAEKLAPRVIRVVAVLTPPRPYRQVPMLYFGHAIWVSPPPPAASEGKFDDESSIKEADENRVQSPVLISSLDWLESADKIYAIDPTAALTDAEKNAQTQASAAGPGLKVPRRSLGSVGTGDAGEKWLKEHRDALIALAPTDPDKHRNLVALRAETSRLAPPPRGIELFDARGQVLFRLYGYSPYAGNFLTASRLLPDTPKNPALAFYWQTSYPGILGAPLVSGEGKLVAINTIRHPEEDALFLAIPTTAIASYLRARTGKPGDPGVTHAPHHGVRSPDREPGPAAEADRKTP